MAALQIDQDHDHDHDQDHDAFSILAGFGRSTLAHRDPPDRFPETGEASLRDSALSEPVVVVLVVVVVVVDQ